MRCLIITKTYIKHILGLGKNWALGFFIREGTRKEQRIEKLFKIQNQDFSYMEREYFLIRHSIPLKAQKRNLLGIYEF
jgi:hypothetical protein